MATYEITLEFETVLSVDGTRVKSETSRETQIVTGVFADVAKALNDYRFCGGGLYIHTKFVGQYAKVDFIDVNGKPVKSI